MALLGDVQTPLPPATDEAPVRAHAYGAGHFVGAVRGRPASLHPGDNPGFQVLALWFPDTSAVTVVLSNDEEDDVVAAALEASGELPTR